MMGMSYEAPRVFRRLPLVTRSRYEQDDEQIFTRSTGT
ncbi:hypothetical protein J2W40_003745, partial [Sphingobium xenophagum]|nr:hypothetical protein [Sphingobium xenophagum]